MEMDRAIIPGLLTVGAGLLTAWYFNREQRRKDQESIRRLEEQTASLEAEIRSLKAAVGEHKLKEKEASDGDAQLKELSERLKKLGEQKKRVMKIGTRDSELAMWQAKHVNAMLKRLGLETEIVGMKTMGDIDLKSALSTFSNKGIFTKELDAALLLKKVHIAVHSMKDLPTTLEDGLFLGAVLERGAIEDALVISAKHKNNKPITSLDTLPTGSLVGTSALRRRAVLRRHYPGLQVDDVRGNLQTRLAKLDNPKLKFDALILARTGLERVNLGDRISEVLDSKRFGYAVSQGALAVVCRTADGLSREVLSKLNHAPTYLRTAAERSLLKTLEGGCKVPIAVTSDYDKKTGTMRLKGWVVALDGSREAVAELTSTEISGTLEHATEKAVKLGQAVGEELRKRGAEEILVECRGMPMGHQAPKKAS